MGSHLHSLPQQTNKLSSVAGCEVVAAVSIEAPADFCGSGSGPEIAGGNKRSRKPCFAAKEDLSAMLS